MSHSVWKRADEGGHEYTLQGREIAVCIQKQKRSMHF